VFLWGRKYYHDAASVEAAVRPELKEQPRAFDRVAELTRYQSASYAREYESFVATVRTKAPALTEPVARYLYKLMAYKDEYEVARLLTKRDVEEKALGMWAQPESLSYNLHPPILRAFGYKKKLQLGPWARGPLRALAALKVVRGTALDVFGWMPHRRMERSLIGWYRGVVEQLLSNVTPENESVAIEITSIPDMIRGYENIKEDSIRAAKELAEKKLAEFRRLREREVVR
jgi:indolepyruvate ferredoxin oxidoreductase